MELGGDGGDGLGARQAQVPLGQGLGERGAVDADARGDGRAARAAALDELAEALLEQLDGLVAVADVARHAGECEPSEADCHVCGMNAT